MANQGKRMVKENLIAKIGQGGGGGSEYTAGNGINISAQDVISVDTDTIATAQQLTSFTESFGGALNNILNTGEYIVVKARQDENGNEIDTTYATKMEDYVLSGSYTSLTDAEFAALEAKIQNLRLVNSYDGNTRYYNLHHSYESSSYIEYDFFSPEDALTIYHYSGQYRVQG